MMLVLGEWLAGFNDGFRVIEYITLRAIFAALTSLIFCLLCGPLMIHWLMRASIGQSVREDGPSSHLSKAGTPTMGGALILIVIFVTTLLWGDLSSRQVWVVLTVTMAFGAIGWVDDYLKISRRNSAGLVARWKYFWQSVKTRNVTDYLKRRLVSLGCTPRCLVACIWNLAGTCTRSLKSSTTKWCWSGI